MRAHLRTNSCQKLERVDFSQGITTEQERDLKSRRTKCTTVQEDHWKAIFLIVFPQHQGDIPSSTCKLIRHFLQYVI
jgi:hypothetical protein